MPAFSESVTVKCPTDIVFDYVADIARWPEWRMTLSSAECVPPGPIAVGTSIRATGRMMGRPMEMGIEVTAFEPGRRIGIRSLSGPADVAGEFTFAAEGDGTRLTIAGTVEPSGVLKLAGPLLARQVHEMWATDFAALKGMLED